MSRKVFTAGEVLAAADVNSFLMDQAVMSFAGTAARGSAIGTAVEGMTVYLEDSDRYESYSGAAWRPVVSTGSWVSYTPTFTNVTNGNATLNFKYIQIGKTVHVRGSFVLGSTSSITGMPIISLPVNASSDIPGSTQLGGAYAEDAGVTGYALMIRLNDTTSVNVLAFGAGGTYLTTAPASSTIPFTWGTNDLFRFSITYEAA